MPFARSIVSPVVQSAVRGAPSSAISPIMNRGGTLIGANPCAGLPLWLSSGAFHLMTAAAEQEALAPGVAAIGVAGLLGFFFEIEGFLNFGRSHQLEGLLGELVHA